MEKQTFLLMRSSRRTLAIEITPDASLVVRAPRRLPLKDIQRFIASRENWIEQKQAEALARPKPTAKQYVDGETFMLMGKMCFLRLVDFDSAEVDFDGRLLLARKALPHAHEALTKWYRKQARLIFAERVKKFGLIMNCHPAGIRITSPGRRWGSCGVTNSLNFNWRLIMAPPEILNYVVVHEIAHITHKNHGSEFWKRVETFIPDHHIARRWLRENGHLLEV